MKAYAPQERVTPLTAARQNLHTAKETVSKVERQPLEWEKIIAMKQLTKD